MTIAFAFWTQWRRQDALHRPTASKARVNSVPGQSCAHAPGRHTHRVAVERKQAILRRVAVLFGVRRPLTVIWTVVAVAIDAFQRQALRAAAHISQKVGVVLPPITNANAATAVSVVPRIVRIVATPMHRGPRAVLARGAGMCRIAVCFVTLSSQATTTLRSATGQFLADNERFVAAFATAAPDDKRAAPACGRFNRGESAGHVAGEIARCGTVANSHAASCVLGAVLVRACGSSKAACRLVFYYPLQLTLDAVAIG